MMRTSSDIAALLAKAEQIAQSTLRNAFQGEAERIRAAGPLT